MAHILIIKDEQELGRLISSALRDDGHTTEVIRADNSRWTGSITHKLPIPIWSSSIYMLPHVGGLTICRHLRKTRTVPIVMLTAKSTELDKVLGLEF